jgi:iron-sulfur cluster assembly protein
MMTITENAAKQILSAAEEGQTQGLALRIAARRKPDGSIDYAMGFDRADGQDTQIHVHGVEVIVAPTSTELLREAILDYVELEPGDFQFIFMNPNDPHYVPPKEDSPTS